MQQAPVSLAEQADGLTDAQVREILDHYSSHPYDPKAIRGDPTLGVTNEAWLGEVVRVANSRAIPMPKPF